MLSDEFQKTIPRRLAGEHRSDDRLRMAVGIRRRRFGEGNIASSRQKY